MFQEHVSKASRLGGKMYLFCLEYLILHFSLLMKQAINLLSIKI